MYLWHGRLSRTHDPTYQMELNVCPVYLSATLKFLINTLVQGKRSRAQKSLPSKNVRF